MFLAKTLFSLIRIQLYTDTTVVTNVDIVA